MSISLPVLIRDRAVVRIVSTGEDAASIEGTLVVGEVRGAC